MKRIKPTKVTNPSEQAKRLPFGPPPLIPGENAADYDELLAHISGTVKPSDILEEIWVRDLVDLTWEAFRLRRLKAGLLAANMGRGIESILQSFMESHEAAGTARNWVLGDEDVVKVVDELLASADLTKDSVMAHTLSVKIDDIERIDRMLMAQEARRSAALREIDRHRATLGQRLRQAVQQVEDAEFEEIKSKAIAHGNAA